MRTKGIGPRGLGVSPFKQTKRQSIMQNEDGSAYTKKQEKQEFLDDFLSNDQQPRRESSEFKKGLPDYNSRKMATGAVAPVIDLTDMLTGGPVGGLAKKAVIGAAVRSGFISSVKKGAKKLFGNSKNKKALDAFLKASPKDATKTTRLSNYNNSPSSNLRQDSFGGTTSTGSRRNYNIFGSN